MLTDAQIERYSRQILLPEVGGIGQERLLAARVVVAGTNALAVTVSAMLARAGVGAVTGGGAPDVIVHVFDDLAAARALPSVAGRPFVLGMLEGARATVISLVGRPCIACLPDVRTSPQPPAGSLAAPAGLALAALAATEILRILLWPAGPGRRTTLDLSAGTAHAADLTPTGGCAACGARA